jgi:tetraacyldisaccharide 4'-kinase
MSLRDRIEHTVWPRRGFAGQVGYCLLRPLSALFGAAVAAREVAYRSGLARVHRAPLPVVSVGNLAVGGTGKTPFTLWLARGLVDRGRNVAILSRGYGSARAGVRVVSRGQGPEIGVAEAGDEPVMMAKSFPGVVLVAPRRIDGAASAAALGCDVAVLDDGFQHRAIMRDFDIVLLDARRRTLLPAGPLREGLRALRRADAVVLIGEDAEIVVPGVLRGRARTGVYRMRTQAAALVESVGGQWHERPLGDLAGRRVIAVAGIARPARFFDLLRQWDTEILEVFEFPDHHRYTSAECHRIGRQARSADLIVTTEKDLVKLEAFPFEAGKLVAVRITPEIARAEELLGSVTAALDKRRA